LLLVSDLSSVVAVGPHGVEWTNLLRSYGELDVVDVTDDIVTCRVRDRDSLEWQCALATSSGEILDREPVGHLGGIDSRFSSESGAKIEVFSPSNLPGVLLDVDMTPDGHWFAIAGSRDGKVLIFPEGTMPMPGLTWYSMVRSIDDDHALVVGGVSPDGVSAWIMSAARGVERTLDVDSPSDVLASVRHIVAAYDDQGGFSVEPYPFEKALAVFDGDGNYQFGYYEKFGDQVVDAYDVYALCWNGDETVTFYPYPEFALVQVDLVRREQQVVPGPAAVTGFHAMSVKREDVRFYGGYDKRSVLWRWQSKIEQLTPIGEFNGQTRGLRDGKFIAFEGKEFAVITCPDTGSDASGG
jgi:hypothetical protein